jgi:hypothetical protein
VTASLFNLPLPGHRYAMPSHTVIVLVLVSISEFTPNPPTLFFVVSEGAHHALCPFLCENTVTWLDTAPRPTSSVYPPPPSPSSSSGPSWKLPAPESIFSSHSDFSSGLPTSRDVRVPRISPRAASYAAVLDVQAGIDARKSEVPQPLREEIPASPAGSVDSIDLFSGRAAEVGFGDRVERGGGRVEESGSRVVPVRPKRYEGVSPYVA